MDQQQVEQINNALHCNFHEMQQLLLQGSCFDEYPHVVSSVETGRGKGALNTNWQVALDFKQNNGCRPELAGSAAEEIFCKKSMDIISNSDPLNINVSMQQNDNVAFTNPNAPTAAHKYWEHAHNKEELNYATYNYLTGCSSNPQGSLPLPIISYQTSLDLPSPSPRQEGISNNQLCNSRVSSDRQNSVQFKEFPTLEYCSYLHSEYSSVGMLRSSKYLKAAQQLLKEVCSVNLSACYDHDRTPKASQSRTSGAILQHSCKTSNDDSLHQTGPSWLSKPQKAENKSGGVQLGERLHLQMRKSQLIGMVEELDKEYQQYHEKMQLIITSFESATGIDAAAPYTTLAKKSISRQFRALRDTMEQQIADVCWMLGEDISSVPILKKGETPRLRVLDQRLRHHQTLQQVSLLPQAAYWRPQRGLPDRSVSVLRAWLFEHFLHPYPTDSEKLMLARLTGLTRSQVTNWFINARVRVWKPMVEQMYAEERKEVESKSQISQAGRAEYEQTRFADSVSGCDFRGKNVTAPVMQENPVKKRSLCDHPVQYGECNTHSSIMTKHGVSLTLALQHSSLDELPPNTYKANQYFLLHPDSGGADYGDIGDVFS